MLCLFKGDVAKVDQDGYFTITDRLKELIKYKGFQVRICLDYIVKSTFCSINEKDHIVCLRSSVLLNCIHMLCKFKLQRVPEIKCLFVCLN